MFPFLIGKVLTMGQALSEIRFPDGSFPFLIGKVLTFNESGYKYSDVSVVSIPYR